MGREIRISTPSLDSPLLAYETGLHIADGSLYFRRRGTGTDYCVYFHGNLKKEYRFYHDTVNPMLKELYNVDGHLTKKPKNTCQIAVYSKRLFEFKRRVLGLREGEHKVTTLPKRLCHSKHNTIALLSGLFDGEASMTILAKRRYPRVKFEMANERLVREVRSRLTSLEVNTTSVYKNERLDRRTGKLQVTWYFNVNGRENCSNLFRVLEFRNPKLHAIYDKLKEND